MTPRLLSVAVSEVHFIKCSTWRRRIPLVAEADESDGSFLKLVPTIGVVTNIDEEHLDHWHGGIAEIEEAFIDFVNKVPFYGCAVMPRPSKGSVHST